MNGKIHIRIKTAQASGLLLAICLLMLQGQLRAQQIFNKGATITIPEGSKIYLGTYVDEGGAVDNNGEMFVRDSIVNNTATFGIFGDEAAHPTAGRVVFSGSGSQQISGSGMAVFFNDLTLDNSSGTPLTLYKGVNVNNALRLSTGNINLNGRTINLGTNGYLENEGNDQRIYGTRGEILATRNLTNYSGDIANLGLYLEAPSSNFGLTEIRRAHHQLSPFSSNGHVNRFYDFRPTNPDGSLVDRVGLTFFDAEKLPGHNLADYKVFHSNTDGFSWVKEKSVPDDNPEFDFQAMAMDVKNFGGKSPALKRSLVTLSEGTCANPPAVDLGPASRKLCEGSSLQLTGPAGQQAYIWRKDNVIIPSATTRELPVTEAGVYQLQVIDANGCDGFGEVTVDVKEKPTANFEVDNFACKGDATTFTDLSSSTDGPLTYHWDFGDPASTADTSNVASPSYTYASAGGFTTSLVVTSSFGCVSDVKTETAIVNARPVADFSADEACFGNPTTLTNHSTSGTTSAWDLGNGDTSTERDPQHTFPFINANSVTLVITDPNTGCSQSVTRDVIVNPIPIADFTFKKACEPNEVIFDNTSVISSGTIRYNWSFGDGEISSSEDVTKTYLYAGSYTVTLDVTSGKGCHATKTQDVAVSMPQPIFGDDRTTCESEVILDANESGRFTGGTFEWSDGSTNPTLTVQSSGTYSVTVRMPDGCETTGSINVTINKPVTPTLAPTVVACGAQTLDAGSFPNVSYEWSTGHTSQTVTVDKSGTYQVSITDGNGCVAKASVDVTINPVPVAGFTATTSCAPNNIAFDNTSTVTSGSMNYVWQFGDGKGSTSEDVVKPYSAAGTYNVTLDVTSDKGCHASKTDKVTVYMPEPVFGGDITTCGTQLVLNANESGRFTGGTFKWSDNSTNEKLTVLTSGTYGVTITMPDGCETTGSVHVSLNKPVTLSLDADMEACGSQTLNPGFFQEATYEWSTGETSPAITVSSSGTYHVKVTDQNGCTDEGSTRVTINPVPVADFTATPSCKPNEINFDNASAISSGTMHYNWEFGDGEARTSEDVFKTYLQEGTFDVTLNATSDKGCHSSKTESVAVSMPQPVFGEDITTCEPEVVLDANESGRFTGGSFEWSDNSTGQKLTVRSSGTYSVSIRMPDGCQTTGAINITLNRPVTPSLETNLAGCGPRTIDAGFFPGVSYEWSTGETSQAITVSESGTYHVNITDKNGCVGEASTFVTINSLPDVDLGGDQVICNGETAQFDAGTSGSTYLWSDGSTNRLLRAGASGTYSVKVTNAAGCSASDEAQLEVLPPVSVDLGPDKVVCEGTAVTLDADIDNVTYLWSSSNGISGTSRTLETSDGGTYRVTVTTINGCTASDSITVNETSNTLNALFLSASEVKPGDTLQFVNTSYPGPFASSWDFGNGQQSTEEDPTVIYYQEGVYKVRLEITNEICATSLVKSITVKQDSVSGGRVNTTPGDIVSARAYPNPTDGELHIEIKLSSRMNAAITILNTIGLQFFSEEVKTEFIKKTFDLRELTRGVYIIKIVTPRQSKFLRVLKI